MGIVSGGGGASFASAAGMSADGSVVVGYDHFPNWAWDSVGPLQEASTT